jgi:hypothetical protein
MSRAKRTKRTKRTKCERFVVDAHAAPQDDAIDWLVNTTGYMRLQVPPDGKCLLHCFAAATGRTVDEVLLNMKQCFVSNPQLDVEGVRLLNCVYEGLEVPQGNGGVDWAMWMDAYYANLPASHCDIFSIMLGAKALNLSVQIYDGTLYHDPRTSRRGRGVTYCSVSPLRCAGVTHGEIQVHLLRERSGKDYHYDLLLKEAEEIENKEIEEDDKKDKEEEIKERDDEEFEENEDPKKQETKEDEANVDALATPPTSPQQQATAGAAPQHYLKTYDGTLPDGYNFSKEVTQALKKRVNVSLYYNDQFLNTVTFVEANVKAKVGGKRNAEDGKKSGNPFAAFYLVENHAENRHHLPPTKLAASQAYVAFKQRLLLNLTNSCPAVIFVAEKDVPLWRYDIGRHDSLNVVLVSGTSLLRKALQDALPTCEYSAHFEEFAVVAAFKLNNWV